jgi:intracellular sulfur oxidation DsrE/DsrF family protein
MRLVSRFAAACVLALLVGSTSLRAESLRIDVPVVLKQAKIVMNMDHLAFEGDVPTGFNYMRVITQDFAANGTQWQITAIFHGPAGYMMLTDAAYNRVRRATTGNPYRQLIADLQKAGVHFEECGQTARDNGWVNADLLAGVAVNSGANFRIVQLVQDGFVQIQP